MDDAAPPIAIGSSGRLSAQPLTNAVGDHALLIRQAEAPRALLTGERGTERERVVLVPMDEDVELRVDGDALAVWLAHGSVSAATASVPGWASVLGMALVVAVIGFAILGGITFFGWLLRLAA